MTQSGGLTNDPSAGYSHSEEHEQGYPLQDLENGESSGSSEYVNISPLPERADSALSEDGLEEEHQDDEHNAPLLPTTTSVYSERKWESGKKAKSGCLQSIGEWCKGPEPPHKYKIEPFCRGFQTFPVRLLDRFLRTRTAKIWALVAFHLVWALLFFSILHASVTSSAIPGYEAPTRLPCIARLW